MNDQDHRPERPDNRRRTGQAAEDICAHTLRRDGWQILERNWRIRSGEIDLIARRGNVLAIVEVKSTHTGLFHGPTRPAFAVGPNKQRRLRKLASIWIATSGRRVPFQEMRFDVIGVLFDRDGGLAAYDHIENAF
ncbi:MAG: YraN family protein [Solirubrobacterales bacterium]